MRRICLSTIAALAITACETTIPATDGAPPTVNLTGPNGISLSSEREDLRNYDCGNGRVLGGVRGVPAFPIRITVLGADNGGVQSVSGRVQGGAISNPSEGVTISSRVIGGETWEIATASFPSSAPRTGQAISFDVAPTEGTALGGPGTIKIDGSAADFRSNTAYTGSQIIGTREAVCR